LAARANTFGHLGLAACAPDRYSSFSLDAADSIAQRIAAAASLPVASVRAVMRLLEEGATVPFIARYRKEATGSLDEVQIRTVAERQEYLRDLDGRRDTVLRSIAEQGKLTDDLRRRIDACQSKTELEDLYLPFKPKRKTKASVALEQGLGPLADKILAQPSSGNPEIDARAFVNAARGVGSTDDALEGAVDIVIEAIAENVSVRSYVREEMRERGVLATKAIKSKIQGRTKFEDYYDHHEPLSRIPSHRALAVRRGETEGVLRVKVEIDDDRCTERIERMMKLDRRSPYAELLGVAIDDAYKKRLHPAIEKESRAETEARAEREAVEVFAQNLEPLLLAAPFGSRRVVAIDPGIRTGCKCVALDATGKMVAYTTIFPLRSEGERDKAAADLVAFVRKHAPEAIAVGNGTGGRETEALARTALKAANIDAPVISVNESGASVYSASDVARDEFPDLDLTIRGAISIGRRLQDPLAELVKIDPKSIGVGQYQHDVDQAMLASKLHDVVESAVNRVGVELSTASAPLLSYVAGIGPKIAKEIVKHRESRGLSRRDELLEVKGLGPKAFEQCAGFLRIRKGAEPLDASAVHPERYPIVARMAKDLGVSLKDLVGSPERAKAIDIRRYATGDVGEPTLRDIVDELAKPGRDPRSSFEAPKFRDDVSALEDLKEGMILEGVVTNVTAFGAFVDVGVHQDGLVHVSQLADRFVKDPREVVKVGDRVKVRVVGVDLDRRRIALSRKNVN
jgi:protein Tex